MLGSPHSRVVLRRSATILAMGAVLAWAVLEWTRLQGWLESAGPLGAAAFAGLVVVLTACCFPVSVLGVAAGYLWGAWPGYPLLAAGVLTGGAVMFRLGHGGLRGLATRLVERDPRLLVLRGMAADRALRLNLLARLSPFNYGLVCYALAAGPTGWRDYLLGMVATLPSLALQVAAGALARRGLATDALGGWRLAATVVGVAALLALGAVTAHLARRAWREASAREDGDGGGAQDA